MSEAPQYLKFMEFVEDVIKTPVNDQASGTIVITTQEFLEHLYVKSPIEEKIIHEIKHSPENPICIVGPRGSGKSSVGLKVRNDLTAPGEQAFICTIDISPIKGERFFDTRTPGDGRFREYIRKKIIEFYESELLKSTDLKYRFYEYILNRNLGDKDRPESYFRQFDGLISEFNDNFERIPGKTQINAEWLKVHANQDWVRNSIEGIKTQLDLKHYAAALRYLKGYKQQIIWIDNIDSLSEQDEMEMTSAIREMVRTTNGIIRFVVAVREENVTQTEHPREAFAELFQSVIFWGDPDNPSAQSNKAWFVPVAKEDRLKEIYLRRLDFARLKTPVMPDSVAADLTTEEFETLKQLARQVIAAFEAEKGIYVANNSLRDTLNILTGFIKYLLKKGLGQDKRPVAYGFKLWFLQTELLFWLSRHAEGPIGYKFFNIFDHSRLFLKSPDQEAHGYFLPYMVLTAVWNLCLENELSDARFKLPSVADVYRRLATVGFLDEKKILNTIFDLSRSSNGMNNFIAIQISGELENPEKIQNTHRLRLTYRGQVTLNSVCNSYGYIFGLIEQNKALNYHETGIEQDAKTVVKALVTLSQSHLVFLSIARDKWYDNIEDWFATYCRHFGTPISLPFCRIKDIENQGFEYNGHHHFALFLQLVFSSIRHYRSFQYASVNVHLKKIEAAYFEILNGLKKREAIHENDIRDKFREF